MGRKGIVAAPDTVRERVLRLASDLVAIPSYGRDEQGVIRYLADRLERQGIPHRIGELDGTPVNVVAEIGTGSRALVLNSHHDTVPPGDAAFWRTDPLAPVVKDGMLYGRGAGDAKGCLAAMTIAFEALAARRERVPARVILMAVGAEELGGLGTKAETARGLAADAAIVGEPTGLVPMIAHKGVLRLEVEVSGKAAHASDPEAGVNAIVAMAPIISALDRLAGAVRQRSEPHTGSASLVVSTIGGGVAENVVPPRCAISIDRRILPGETEADASREIVEAVTRSLPERMGARVETRKVRFLPPALTEAGSPIAVAALKAAAAVLGRPVRAGGFSATCDMTYLVNDARIPTVILGPGDIGTAHQANEGVSIEELSQAVEVYLKTIETWIDGA